MLQELDLALNDVVLPERLELLLDTYALLNKLGMDDVDTELQQIIGLQDGISDTDLFVSRVSDCLELACRELLTQFGVALIDELPLTTILGVLQTVTDFEYYIIPENVIDIIDSSDTNEEVVVRMTPLFSGLDEVTAMEAVLSVSDSTIARIRQVCLENHVQDPEERELPDYYQWRIDTINHILRATPDMPHLAKQLVDNGIRLGLPLDVVVGQVIDQLAEVPIPDLGTEIIMLVCFSATPIDELGTAAIEIAKALTDDLTEQNRIRRSVVKAYDYHVNHVTNINFPDVGVI